MRPRNTDSSTNSERKATYELLALLALVTGGALILAYLYLGQGEEVRGLEGQAPLARPRSGARELTLDVIAGLEVIVVSYLVGYWVVFRRGLARETELLRAVESLDTAPEVEGFYQSINDVHDLEDTAAGARRIDLVSQYLGSWVSRHNDVFADFFRRAAQDRSAQTDCPYLLRAFFMSPDQPSAATVVHQVDRAQQTPEPSYMREWVLRGVVALFKAHRAAKAPAASLEIYLVKEPLNYFAMGFDNDSLIMFFHEHFLAAPNLAPGVRIDLRTTSRTRGFWANEVAGLVDLPARVKTRVASEQEARRLLAPETEIAGA